MTKRVAEAAVDFDVRKAKKFKKDCSAEFLPRIISSISPAADDNDNLFWQLYIAQLEKLNSGAEKTSSVSKRKFSLSNKRVQWTGFYRRKTDEYDVDIPLDYHRIKIIQNTPQKLTFSAVQKETESVFIIRRVSSTDSLRLQRLFRTLMLHRLLPTDIVMRPCEMYFRDGYVYTIAESMESQLWEIVEDPSTHYCVSRVIHQLLLLLNRMHKMGITHGNITTNSIYFDADMSIKVSNFGNSSQITQDFDEINQDLIAVRSILAKLLLIGSENDKKDEDEEEELDWKCLMESPEESGLTDENARDLLDAMFENKYSCEELLRHDYFKSFKKLEAFEPECGRLDQLASRIHDEMLKTHDATATVSI